MRELVDTEKYDVSGGLVFLPLVVAAPTAAKLFIAGSVFGASLVFVSYKLA